MNVLVCGKQTSLLLCSSGEKYPNNTNASMLQVARLSRKRAKALFVVCRLRRIKANFASVADERYT